MKNKTQSWRIFFIVSIVLYFLSLVVIVALIRNVPNQYVDLQKKENKEIKTQIKMAVENDDQAAYQDIISNNYVDFIVYNKSTKDVEYSSFEIKNNIDLVNKNANTNVISNKDKILIEKNGVDYEIWIIQYFISPQKIFDIWIITLIIIITSLLTIVVIALAILFFKYIKPIQRLKETVHNISSYQLEFINNAAKKNTEYDQINKTLLDFSYELEENMKKTGYQYSLLETKLLAKNESIEYKNELLGSLAHDLKSPITLSILKLNALENEINATEIESIKDKLEKVIDEINGINKIIFKDNENQFLQKEQVDVISLIMETINDFEELFDNRGFIVDYNIDDKVVIEVNALRLKQLIYNALSNIYDHALEEANVVIGCYKENNQVILSFYNDSNSVAEEDLKNLFSLFYKKDDNERNSGLGMYTMKTIVKEMNGEISARNYEDGIIIEVILNVED